MFVLDASQQAAAAADQAVQLVLAGPGAGKTQTLVGRFKHLADRQVDPRRILAVTYTKKAADEMRVRIARMLGLDGGAELRIYTFHALALRCLKRNPHLAGLAPDFEVWSAPRQRAVFSARRMFWNEDQDILDIIGGAKENLLDAKTFEAALKPEDRLGWLALPFFTVYEQALRAAGAIDFADMVPVLLKAIADHPAYGESIGRTVDHLLVDEYQDINPGQERLIAHFRRCGVHLWAVGDDDQTLYTFRSADVRHILGFKARHPGAAVHILDRNYRSVPQIVSAARRLIGHNRQRFAKTYAPTQPEAGSIVIRGYSAADIEVRQVTRTIAALLEGGVEPQNIAVLYRVGSVGLGFQIALGAAGIDFEVRGAGDLWQGVVARLFLGSLFYLLDGDDRRALEKMGTGKRAAQLRHRLDDIASPRGRSFADLSRAVQAIVASALPQKASEAERRDWAGVSEAIASLAVACSSLEMFLDRIEAQSRASRHASERAVVLSTVHSAKGLEWEAVFVVGLEEGLLPSAGAELEEERRVAYVAVTRARTLLGLTYARTRGGANPRRSRFIDEFAAGRFVDTGPGAAGADERLVRLSPGEVPVVAGDEAIPRLQRARGRPDGEDRRGAAGKPISPQWTRRDDLKLRFGCAAASNLEDLCSGVARPADDVLARLVVLRLAPNTAAAAALWDRTPP
jgi:DNA helicase-2/ATP-dependent DNA helicase PcrA